MKTATGFRSGCPATAYAQARLERLFQKRSRGPLRVREIKIKKVEDPSLKPKLLSEVSFVLDILGTIPAFSLYQWANKVWQASAVIIHLQGQKWK